MAVPRYSDFYTNKELCRSLDCDFGNPQACFDYSEYPYCTSECEFFASTTTSLDAPVCCSVVQK